MRGYVSFLFVLAALIIFAILSNSYNNSKSINFSEAIALERMEQLSLDAKRDLLIATKYGAIAGFLEYTAEATVSKTFDIIQAKERVKRGVYTSLLFVNPNYLNYESSLWCGEIPDETELGFIAENSIRLGAPQMCKLCQPISSPECKDFISVEIMEEKEKFSIIRVALGFKDLGEEPKIFGITTYSKKFNVSKVSYIPTNENVFEIPYIYEMKP